MVLKQAEIDNHIYDTAKAGPILVTIPKSEYDLLIEIKNKFLSKPTASKD